MIDDPRDTTDALLSADLDDETDADEHARIEADPALVARREELRQAAATAGQAPAPLGDTAVDQLIAKAVSSSRAPSARRQRSGPPPVLVAAVVVLLAAIGIGLIVTAKSTKKDLSTASAPAPGHAESKSAAPSTAPSTAAGESNSDSVAGAAPTSPLEFVGNYASAPALRAQLRARLPKTSAPATTFQAPQVTQGQADRCATVLEARDPRLVRANRRASVAASISGTPVLVFEYRAKAVQGARTTTRVVALGVAACDERVNFQR